MSLWDKCKHIFSELGDYRDMTEMDNQSHTAACHASSWIVIINWPFSYNATDILSFFSHFMLMDSNWIGNGTMTWPYYFNSIFHLRENVFDVVEHFQFFSIWMVNKIAKGFIFWNSIITQRQRRRNVEYGDMNCWHLAIGIQFVFLGFFFISPSFIYLQLLVQCLLLFCVLRSLRCS